MKRRYRKRLQYMIAINDRCSRIYSK